MSFILTTGETREQIKSDDEQTCEAMLDLLGRLAFPGGVLVTRLPSGMGLDFNLQKGNAFLVEFYAGEWSGAFVTRAVAEEIRATLHEFRGQKAPAR
jgi:hypothetical protein